MGQLIEAIGRVRISSYGNLLPEASTRTGMIDVDPPDPGVNRGVISLRRLAPPTLDRAGLSVGLGSRGDSRSVRAGCRRHRPHHQSGNIIPSC